VIVAVLVIRTALAEAFMVPTGSMLNTIQVGDFLLVNKFIYGLKVPFTEKTLIPVSSPKPGDVVVFRAPADPDVPDNCSRIFPAWLPLLPVFWDNNAHFFRWYTPLNLVKRCVAVAGDTVEYRDKQLYVNGRRQVEPYVIHTDKQTWPGSDAGPDSFQQMWEGRRFYRTALAPYVRDRFGPVVVPKCCIMVMGDNRDNSEDARFWGPLDLCHVRGKPMVRYFSSSAASYPVNIPKILLSPGAIRFGRIGRLVR
jgi:signal peptidase I